ncbi:MAG TPA: hypothetical protein VHJ20_20350 [Polyangia bacterium]|nr:hypothetical protein [Polyangia bacterium]
MKRTLRLLGLLGLVLLPAQAAHAKTKAQLLGTLAKGTLNNVLGNEISSALTNLGVFDMLGLGGGTDPVLDAKLDQIIMQLQVVQADITDLKMDVATLTNTVVAQAQMVQLQTLIHDMDDAQNRVTMCAQQVALVAQARGTDATDAQIHDFALQMVGRQAGPCDLSAQFSIIHDRIVTDQTLGSAESAFYSLLAQVAYNSNPRVPFEQIASHFIQYSITQREALELVRGAYSALGEADNLQTVFTTPPNNFLAKLRDEEVAFLQGADAYISAGSPPYDTSPAALADAIVQRLEGVSREATTYSLSIRDDAGDLTPLLVASGTDATRPMLAMGDTVAGAVSTYYGMKNTPITVGLGSCLASPPQDGFAYVRPTGGTGGGFKLGSSCTVHIERHLLKNVPADVAGTWTVNGRNGAVAVGAPALLNAATLATETADEALALAGDSGGRGSGASAFTLVADATDPSTVSLAIDLPGQPMTLVRAGTKHAFVAGAAGDVAKFTRVPFGPRYPDRYALMSGTQYLWIGTDGFAALSDTETWFDFQRTADGHTELVYDGGVVYVDAQYIQVFHGESPDDVWATAPNLAVGTAAINQWALPDDNVPRVRPGTSLQIYPPCLNGAGLGTNASYSFGLGPTLPSSECSDNGLAYVAYWAKFTNEDDKDRTFRLTLTGQADLGTGQSIGYAGIHCFIPGIGSPDDHLDTDLPQVTTAMPSKSTTPQVFDPSNRNVTVPAHGSLSVDCQILDARGLTPARMTFTQFIVQPCKGSAGGTCGSYP